MKKKGGITWFRSTKIINKLLTLDIFRLIRPFSRVQIDTLIIQVISLTNCRNSKVLSEGGGLNNRRLAENKREYA